MKKDFSPIDDSIVHVLAERPCRLEEILQVPTIRELALLVVRLRAGLSRSESADVTVHERLQILRRDGKVSYDRSTSRWHISVVGASPSAGA